MFDVDYALRSRTEQPVKRADFVRIWRRGHTLMGVAGAATRDGFETWPEASAELLDVCEAAFEGRGEVALQAVFEAATAWLAERASRHQSAGDEEALDAEDTAESAAEISGIQPVGEVDPEDLERSGFDLGALTNSGFQVPVPAVVQTDGPSAWLTAFIVSNEQLLIRWSGGDELWLIDANGMRFRSEGHHQRVRPLAAHPNVVTRGLGAGYVDGIGPDTASAVCPRGTRLVLVSRPIAQGADRPAVVRALRETPLAAAAQRVLAATGWHPGARVAYVAVVDV